jgi:hypothetical protein
VSNINNKSDQLRKDFGREKEIDFFVFDFFLINFCTLYFVRRRLFRQRCLEETTYLLRLVTCVYATTVIQDLTCLPATGQISVQLAWPCLR